MNKKMALWQTAKPMIIATILFDGWWLILTSIVQILNWVLGTHHVIHTDYWMGHTPGHNYLSACFLGWLIPLWYAGKKANAVVSALEAEHNKRRRGKLIFFAAPEGMIATIGLGSGLGLAWPFVQTMWDFSVPHLVYIALIILGLISLMSINVKLNISR